MSYNILHGKGADRKVDISRAADAIMRENPDFVGLQEVDRRVRRSRKIDEPAELGRLTGLHPTFASAFPYQGGEYGRAMLSREKPLAVERIQLDGKHPGVLLLCEFRDFWFGTMHLDLIETNRLRQVGIVRDAVAAKSQTKPVFLTGDWNATPKSKTLDAMRKFMTVLSREDDRTFHGYRGKKALKGYCIDYIAVDSAHAGMVTVKESHVTQNEIASDHNPLVATVSLAAKPDVPVVVVSDKPKEVEVRQVFRPERYQRGDTNVSRVQDIDDAHWIWHPTAVSKGEVGKYAFLRFRKEFTADAAPLTFDVSGDERFTLLIDGEPVSFGPHRGMVENWLYQSYEAKLAPGKHVMEAVVWVLGPHAPSAQLSWRGGFILKADGAYHKQLTTGIADWRVAELKNVTMRSEGMRRNFGVGAQSEVRGCSLLDERPAESEYVQAKSVRGPVRYNVCGIRAKGWMLAPTPLPDQSYDRVRPGTFRAARATFDRGAYYKAEDGRHPRLGELNALLKEGQSMTIPSNTIFCALLDLDDYYCAYPELIVDGGKGSEIRWMWVESTRHESKRKGNRNEFVGKNCSHYFLMDRFFPDGRAGARFGAPWWRTGRWCQLEIKTVGEPLVLKDISIIETRYPTPVTSHFKCDDASLDGVQKVCIRGMQMDMHEHMCDGPHYEQQMYVGDTLVQSDVSAAMFADDRLVRRAISIFDFARRDNGMLPMNFPTVGTQESATYTMIWPMLLENYMMWHDNAAWLKARLPGLAHTMLGLAEFENGDGLLESLPGWSFIDWVETPKRWYAGIPPNGKPGCGVNSQNNLFYVLALQAAAKVSAQLGNAELAALWRGKADALGKKVVATFWDDVNGMVADTPAKDSFSQHSQILAILAGVLSPAQEDAAFKALVERKDIAVATDYFRYYLFKVYAKKGRMDLFMEKMDFWREHVKRGIRCPLEDDDYEAKSDCHAWASHPLFFLHSAVAGVTPAEPYFRSVRIAPQPGGLKWIDSATPHPKGMILVKLRFGGGVGARRPTDDAVEGEVTLPAGVSGTFEWKGRHQPLNPGCNVITM